MKRGERGAGRSSTGAIKKKVGETLAGGKRAQESECQQTPRGQAGTTKSNRSNKVQSPSSQEMPIARCREVFGAMPDELTTRTRLQIHDKELCSADLQHLRACSLVTELSFTNCRGAIDLSVLAGMSALKDLQIFVSEISSHEALLQHRQLKRLYLSQSNMGSGIAQYLQHMNQLEELVLEYICDNIDLSGIARLPKLRYLRLSDAYITEESLIALSKSKCLRKIESEKLSTPDFSHLAELQPLEELTLGLCIHYQKGFGALSKLPLLRYLKITSALVTDEDVRELSQHEGLKGLHIGGSVKLTDITPLSKIKTLEELWLRSLFRLKSGLGSLRELRNLHRLDMSTTPVNDEDVKNISTIDSLVSITFLASKGLKTVEPLAVVSALKHLNIQFVPPRTFEYAEFVDYLIHTKYGLLSPEGEKYGVALLTVGPLPGC
ncbi:hypothetical protein ERJ75_000454900 [Trypanosoma vivax]|nr:hypothetical protein ERJ75_000454900 [Trypanosoma vivax]